MSEKDLTKLLEDCTEIYNKKGILAVNNYKTSLQENGEISSFELEVLDSFENYLNETCTGGNRFRQLHFEEARYFLEKEINGQASYL